MSYQHERSQRHPLPNAGRVEDFTAPFLWTAGLLLFVVLFAIWAAYGMGTVLIVSALADVLLKRRR